MILSGEKNRKSIALIHTLRKRIVLHCLADSTVIQEENDKFT